MSLNGMRPHDEEIAAFYEKRRWWLGLTLGDMFDRTCDAYPQKEALVGDGGRYTYRCLRERVDNMACRLLRGGLNSGDTVLLQAPNWPTPWPMKSTIP